MDPICQRALDAFYSKSRDNCPEMTLDEINAEISAARNSKIVQTCLK